MGLGWVRVHGLDSYQIVPGILSLWRLGCKNCRWNCWTLRFWTCWIAWSFCFGWDFVHSAGSRAAKETSVGRRPQIPIRRGCYDIIAITMSLDWSRNQQNHISISSKVCGIILTMAIHQSWRIHHVMSFFEMIVWVFVTHSKMVLWGRFLLVFVRHIVVPKKHEKRWTSETCRNSEIKIFRVW